MPEEIPKDTTVVVGPANKEVQENFDRNNAFWAFGVSPAEIRQVYENMGILPPKKKRKLAQVTGEDPPLQELTTEGSSKKLRETWKSLSGFIENLGDIRKKKELDDILSAQNNFAEDIQKHTDTVQRLTQSLDEQKEIVAEQERWGIVTNPDGTLCSRNQPGFCVRPPIPVITEEMTASINKLKKEEEHQRRGISEQCRSLVTRSMKHMFSWNGSGTEKDTLSLTFSLTFFFFFHSHTRNKHTDRTDRQKKITRQVIALSKCQTRTLRNNARKTRPQRCRRF